MGSAKKYYQKIILILKSVQNDTKKELLKYLIEISISKYEINSNPLGLVDDSIKKLNNFPITLFISTKGCD